METELRFGVGDLKSGMRAATWKLWTAKNTPDVYLVCRQIGSGIKLSLHESGRWHFAFGSKDLFDQDNVPESRFLGVYEGAPELIAGMKLACRVHTPWFANSVSLDPSDEANTVWISAAPERHSVEVAICVYKDCHPEPGSWPGKESMGTKLVGEIDLAGRGSVVAVHSIVPFVDLLPKEAGQPKYFKQQSANELLTPGMRVMGWTQHADGSIVVMEGPVLVERRG